MSRPASAAVRCASHLALLSLVACSPHTISLGAYEPDSGDRESGADAALDASRIDAQAADGDGSTTAGQYIEAETGELSGGFRVATDNAASATRYLAPPDGRSDAEPGPARARYTFEVKRSATYLVWGRIRGPDVDHNRFWFQLDGSDWHKWRLSTGDIWYWDAFHEDTDYGHAIPFQLTAGTHTLVIANWVDIVGLDRLYVAEPGDLPIGNATLCKPPHSIERNGECEASCGSHGHTGCGGSACQDRPVLSTYDCAVCCILDP